MIADSSAIILLRNSWFAKLASKRALVKPLSIDLVKYFFAKSLLPFRLSICEK